MGNTVGSRGVLSAKQAHIIVGTLLGDACLEKNGKNCRLRVDHNKRYKEYIFWLADQLQPFSLKPRLVYDRDKRNGKVYKRWHLSTRSLPLLNKYRKLFYKGRKKIVPTNLYKFLSPLSLAVWYMDDGFKRKDCKGFYLCTSSYTLAEQKAIINVLQVCFGVKTKIHHQRQYQRIFIPAKFAEYFNELIRPYILPIFAYKLL